MPAESLILYGFKGVSVLGSQILTRGILASSQQWQLVGNWQPNFLFQSEIHSTPRSSGVDVQAIAWNLCGVSVLRRGLSRFVHWVPDMCSWVNPQTTDVLLKLDMKSPHDCFWMFLISEMTCCMELLDGFTSKHTGSEDVYNAYSRPGHHMQKSPGQILIAACNACTIYTYRYVSYVVLISFPQFCTVLYITLGCFVLNSLILAINCSNSSIQILLLQSPGVERDMHCWTIDPWKMRSVSNIVKFKIIDFHKLSTVNLNDVCLPTSVL